MRILVLAASLAAVALPATAASAQSWGDYREYQREVRQEQRECARELRRADSRREYRRERRECRRSEEHTSELQSLMRISYAVFCLKKKKNTSTKIHHKTTDKDKPHNKTK